MKRLHNIDLYVIALALATVSVLAVAIVATVHSGYRDPLALARLIALFALLGWLGNNRRALVSESSEHVMGTTAQIATLVAMSSAVPAAAILTVAIAKSLGELTLRVQLRNRSWRGAIVNLSSAILENAGALCAFHLLNGDRFLWSNGASAALAVPGLVAMALAYYAINVAIILGAISFTSNERVIPLFARVAKDTIVPEMSLILTGIVFAMLWHFRPVLSLFVLIPVILSIRSFESVSKLRKETVTAVIKMAESIDYRDTGTYEHSQRISALSKKLAQRLGLTPEHCGDIALASKVHDLGKIGISNDILLKQGPLTAEERELMKDHTVIGANILTSYSAFHASVPIVRHHHERWDGNGYPDGLKGDEIPMGSRIIGVVDAFDSMTADRPYRKGMPVEEAITRLKQGIGTQFDPQVCGTFIQLLIDEGIYLPSAAPDDRAPELHLVRAGREAV